MIEWLSGWLKQLVLVIMIATFVDMLLPNKSMERYVRAVLGLFILMVLLSPVISLFQPESAWTRKLRDLEEPGSIESDSRLPPIKPLPAILEDADKIRAGNLEQMKRHVESGVEGMVKQELEQQVPHIKVSHVSSEVEFDQNGTPGLRRIQVTFTEKDAEQAAPPQAGQVMEAIAPVEIHIDIGSEPIRKQPTSGPDSAQTKRTKEQIAGLLQMRWQLTEEQIAVFHRDEPG